jgi:GDP-D-mannose dehydratase
MDLKTNLVVGNNSQLARYFPVSNTTFISSRNISITDVSQYDNVFFFFCEQRTFLNLTEKDFIDINVNLTIKLLENLYNKKTKFYLYGTCELWNKLEGAVSIDSPISYNPTPYVISKHMLLEAVNEFRKKNDATNIILLHPFNFNTPYRTEGFLFSKIFNSIINNVKIQTGSLDFSRDLIHPNFILNKSFTSEKDDLIGSGNAVNIREFVSKLYDTFNMKVEDYLQEDILIKPRHTNLFFYKTDNKYTTLLEDTIDDIKKIKK